MARFEATGILSTPGVGSPVPIGGSDFHLTIWGSFTGTIRLLRSFDGGASWRPLTFIDGLQLTWTGPLSTLLPEIENGSQYALEALPDFTGTANWRMSQ